VKVCSKCKTEKNTDEFSRSRATKDGLRHWCKACVKDNAGKVRAQIVVPDTKVCRRCGKEKSYREFTSDRSGHYDGLSSRCKQCLREVTRGEKNRKYDLRKFGLTLEQYDQMYAAQNGGCAICGGQNDDGRRLFVDHNHQTGRVRGLLCARCNTRTGVYELFGRQIAAYLNKYDRPQPPNRKVK
jgi:hypothetical protein